MTDIVQNITNRLLLEEGGSEAKKSLDLKSASNFRSL